MKYLSIDLEACNKYVKGSVFSVGMVLADENFNIIFKKNVWLNPLCRFAMNFRKPIDFKVTHDDLVDKPTFAEVRDELATYLEAPDTVVMAHSANNDMFMLNYGCMRAGVKPFTFDFVCTQMIYSAVYNVENGVGLDKVAVQLGREQFTHHQADDDAEMALYLLQNCLETSGKTFEELLKSYSITMGHIGGGKLTSMQCGAIQKMRERRKAHAIELQKRWNKELKQGGKFTMQLDVKQFDLMKCGIKTVEVRINDEKRKKIKVGDCIYFVRNSARPQLLKVKVVDIATFPSFEEVYAAFDKAKLGFRDATLITYLENMYSYYAEKHEYECGVVAFSVEVCAE